jgi:hypothetical protein
MSSVKPRFRRQVVPEIMLNEISGLDVTDEPNGTSPPHEITGARPSPNRLRLSLPRAILRLRISKHILSERATRFSFHTGHVSITPAMLL